MRLQVERARSSGFQLEFGRLFEFWLGFTLGFGFFLERDWSRRFNGPRIRLARFGSDLEAVRDRRLVERRGVTRVLCRREGRGFEPYGILRCVAGSALGERLDECVRVDLDLDLARVGVQSGVRLDVTRRRNRLLFQVGSVRRFFVGV